MRADKALINRNKEPLGRMTAILACAVLLALAPVLSQRAGAEFKERSAVFELIKSSVTGWLRNEGITDEEYYHLCGELEGYCRGCEVELQVSRGRTFNIGDEVRDIIVVNSKESMQLNGNIELHEDDIVSIKVYTKSYEALKTDALVNSVPGRSAVYAYADRMYK